MTTGSLSSTAFRFDLTEKWFDIHMMGCKQKAAMDNCLERSGTFR
jgi:hypothetical protein